MSYELIIIYLPNLANDKFDKPEKILRHFSRIFFYFFFLNPKIFTGNLKILKCAYRVTEDSF